MKMDHVDHCIDSLRQSLMCSSDTSVITWVWDENTHASRGNLNTVHTCRDFEAIRQWALDHEAKKFNQNIPVPDALQETHNNN